MNEKQQQLTFEKGITNVPSDLLCSDNALEESVGMIHDDGEHRVIQKPKTEASGVPGTILCVHKLNDITRYIHLVKHETSYGTDYQLKVSTDCVNAEYVTRIPRDATFETPDVTVTSIGKTLLVSEKDKAIKYYLWNDIPDGSPYVHIGPLPDPIIRFWLEGPTEDFVPELYTKDYDDEIDYVVYNSGTTTGIVADTYMLEAEIDRGKQDDYNNLIAGLYAKNLNAVANKKGFSKPFFVRYALEMFDGTFTHVSNPILLLPSITQSTFSLLYENETMMLLTRYCKLKYSMDSNGLENFSDVVKRVALFVSDGVDIYDTSLSQPLKMFKVERTPSHSVGTVDYYAPLNPEDTYTDGIYCTSSSSYSVYNKIPTEYLLALDTVKHQEGSSDIYLKYFRRVQTLKQKPAQEIVSQLKSVSTFYKICDIGLKSGSGDVADKIETHTLEHLTTLEYLQEDDYFSRSTFQPGFLYAYNSRLNLASAKRNFFLGFDQFLNYQLPQPSTYDIAVRIVTETNEVFIRRENITTDENIGFYFYYPDSRAKHVWIRKIEGQAATMILNAELEEHNGLNGAFYIDKKLPGFDGHTTPTSPSYAEYPSSFNNDAVEDLPNYVITSEVNNPWVFKAEGYNKVGTGKIIGMSTITQALSQGQFGQYPLLVFSESGIWAMSVNNTGLFQAIHPMSREVCNNPDSITQTDGAVFFSSEKGLMVVVGSDVKCVSEQLSGLESDFEGEVKMGNFRDYMKDCFIAYDYRDSLLWIFNNSRQQNQGYCYVYAIKGGTFGKYRFEQPIENVVNNYPDYLLQSGSTLFSLTGRQNINLDTSTYSGLIITRPMKLENGLALKSLMQVRHILQMKGRMTLRIYVSNNLNHWAEVHSLRGTPWKYYRFRFDFSDMKATDRFAGSMVITQERRTDKLL